MGIAQNYDTKKLRRNGLFKEWCHVVSGSEQPNGMAISEKHTAKLIAFPSQEEEV